jgi:hypothetical protein
MCGATPYVLCIQEFTSPCVYTSCGVYVLHHTCVYTSVLHQTERDTHIHKNTYRQQKQRESEREIEGGGGRGTGSSKNKTSGHKTLWLTLEGGKQEHSSTRADKRKLPGLIKRAQAAQRTCSSLSYFHIVPLVQASCTCVSMYVCL